MILNDTLTPSLHLFFPFLLQTQRTQPHPYWMGLIIAKPWQGSVWSYLAKRLGTLSQITAG